MMVAPVRESRRMQRTRYSAEQHFDALDADADEFEAAVVALQTDMKGQRAILLGLMVTIAGGSVIGALNILLHIL